MLRGVVLILAVVRLFGVTGPDHAVYVALHPQHRLAHHLIAGRQCAAFDWRLCRTRSLGWGLLAWRQDLTAAGFLA